MRCANHPERIATRTCAICAAFHCDDCLSEIAGDAVCARCAPAAQQAASASSPDPDGDTTPTATAGTRRWMNRLALGSTVVALVAGLVLLAVLPGKRPEPAWTAPSERQARNAVAIAALERAAIAIETFHAERGTYPASWDELVPDLAPEPVTDPWSDTDAALLLRVPSWDPSSVVLYSIGPDGRDDGGRVYTPETGLGDLVYIVR